jgi:hypothetical protein
MAEWKPSIGDLKGSGDEYRSRAKAETRSRAKAKDILLPKELEHGQWDANKTILTTLGGTLRAITGDDLVKFRRSVDALAERYQSGITPKQVIGLAVKSRRQRARDEIHVAMPVFGSTGKTGADRTTAVVRFLTNAGPDCLRSPARHNVHVQFMSFYAAVNATGMDARKAAAWLRKERIRFDCDCEDHTYRYRFIASSGKFAYGRIETGFPKIRNPELKGVACKHVIRVMQQIDDGMTVLKFLEKMIANARAHHMGKSTAQTTQKQADAIAKRQAARPSQIKTPSARALQRAAGEVFKTVQRKRPPAPNRRATAADAYAEIRRQLAALGLSPAAIDQQVAQIKAAAEKPENA